MMYMKPQKSRKLSYKFTIRNLESILELLDDVKPVLIGKIAIVVYEHYYSLPYNRKFKYIELAISKRKKKHIKEILYTQKTKYNEYGDNIEIEYKEGPSVIILFKDKKIPYNEIEIERKIIKKKKIKLYVAKLEYLYVDKIFTYLNEKKDFYSIKVLGYLMNEYGYDKELLENIFNEYSKKYPEYSLEARNIMEKILKEVKKSDILDIL
ncbi:hypothetical protein [Candidatus Nanobsidianus stetteri]|uniref:Uncharacterized protein n=1 Tax=Nanobsidianus stetteri TaxID=1294122 RepID=A0A2T9WLR3_NANST|nr:hypothetical protein [Candidatus Nanobsidianus stetteri]MCC5447016.1 hypothetical protein [Candidatus Nanobsidianus stetteri]